MALNLGNSNTTLVKVKSKKIVGAKNVWLNSNTTLVKVKFDTVISLTT